VAVRPVSGKTKQDFTESHTYKRAFLARSADPFVGAGATTDAALRSMTGHEPGEMKRRKTR
jgi:hypothetical protein